MKLVSGIVDSGFFAQSALSAEVATKDSLGRNISETYLTGVDLTPYQTVEGMTAYQPAGAYLTTADSANFYPMNENPSGYLTAHQSLADYQLTADMTGYLTTGDSANFLTAVPAGTMNESAFGYDANDKISGYNGSAFAGGSDVPEGVMVESGLEYNAINQISGYNGSAIAQYGHEAQWLVHDDTLVHASNSAQYALGVNVSAVQELMGMMGPKLNEETFAGYWNGQPLYQQLLQMTFSSNSTSTATIPDELYSSAVALGRRWIDPSNSFIHYGSQEISLPISWMLASDRRGSISIINNALHYRGVDGANTGCTAYVCVKYRKA
jgi:hypothetical protein